MIAGFQVTNSPTDHGQLTSVASEVKADYGVDVLESTADKGYECPEDHADALANGIVPNVIQRDGSCTEQVQFDYNEATITGAQKSHTNPEDLKGQSQMPLRASFWNHEASTWAILLFTERQTESNC